jgi:cysteine-rich repeat protein
VNKHLAVDLGGIHTPVEGTLAIANGVVSVVVSNTWPTDELVSINHSPSLGTLTTGGLYEVAVFQAERQKSGSSYMLSLSGFNTPHSVCKPVCGGTNPGLSPGEACDNGDAGNCDPNLADCYNRCTTSCTLGPRCGDGTVQSAHEQCDNGANTDGYAATGSNVCSPDCTLPPNCGDGQVQSNFGEECDNGTYNNDNTSTGCSTTCKNNASGAK